MKSDLYQSYLVRFWQKAQGEEPTISWCGEMESIQTGQKWQFSSFTSMMQYFQKQMEEHSSGMFKQEDST